LTPAQSDSRAKWQLIFSQDFADSFTTMSFLNSKWTWLAAGVLLGVYVVPMLFAKKTA
jgi:hypothetical protein